jgi:hypothetical protein
MCSLYSCSIFPCTLFTRTLFFCTAYSYCIYLCEWVTRLTLTWTLIFGVDHGWLCLTFRFLGQSSGIHLHLTSGTWCWLLDALKSGLTTSWLFILGLTFHPRVDFSSFCRKSTKSSKTHNFAPNIVPMHNLPTNMQTRIRDSQMVIGLA